MGSSQCNFLLPLGLVSWKGSAAPCCCSPVLATCKASLGTQCVRPHEEGQSLKQWSARKALQLFPLTKVEMLGTEVTCPAWQLPNSSVVFEQGKSLLPCLAGAEELEMQGDLASPTCAPGLETAPIEAHIPNSADSSGRLGM